MTRAPTTTTTTTNYLQKLDESIPLRDPVIRSAMGSLQLPRGSRGLDVGCGYGAQAMLLAEAVGEGGLVTGVDISPGFLEYGKKLVRKAGLDDRVVLTPGNMNALPFDEDSFDWAWSMDCVGYHPGDPMPALRELRRVVRPGGLIAVLAWSSEHLLPGHPVQEARLRTTTQGLAPFARGRRPGAHFLCTLGRFHELGLEEATAHTFAGSAHAPLTADIRRALEGLFEMRWGGVESELSREEQAEFRRLCHPGSAEFIQDQEDYYAFFTYSMFRGRVPG